MISLHSAREHLHGLALCVAILAGVTTAAHVAVGSGLSPTVFDGPPAAYSEPLAPDASYGANVLRTISVEERAGVARHQELVRVPIFFHAGECDDVKNLEVITDALAATQPIPVQADDIRRGPDGGISRVHLWFLTDLNANEHRGFRLVRRTGSEPTTIDNVKVEEAGDTVHVRTDGGVLEFTRQGEFKQWSTRSGTWSFANGAFPRVVINTRLPAEPTQKVDVTLDRTNGQRTVQYDSGPCFAKIRLRIEQSDGLALVQEFRIPRSGEEMIVTSSIFPGESPSVLVKEHKFLEGTLAPSLVTPQAQEIPAGLRYALRAEHAYTITALLEKGRPNAIVAVPLVVGGRNGFFRLTENQCSLDGVTGLRRGEEGEKETLRAFWNEVRLVPAAATTPDELWQVYRNRVQPLVAVVEEPGATVERLHTALTALAREMKPVGWRQDAGRLAVFGETKKLEKMLVKIPGPRDTDAEGLLRSARNSTDKITNHGQRALREDEKGRGYGPLDPYHVTYTQSAAAALAVLENAPPNVSAANLAMASGVREFGGKADKAGWPYVDCFSRTLNMQLGPVLFGLTAGATADQKDLAQFYRDLAVSAPVQAVFGRAQRPYTGAPAKSPDQSDYLYQGVCDFWLRTTELLANEDLQLHPLAYSRYTDCIDVMADVYHGVAARDKKDSPGPGFARANFFRGQTHTHRWLGWACSPYTRLLEGVDGERLPGLTEAIRHTESLKGRWKNWPDLTYYILTDLLVRDGLKRYQRPTLLATPESPAVTRNGPANDLRWPAIPGAVAYRVYRAEKPGGPYTWLNSPYAKPAGEPVLHPEFHDAQASSANSYVVTAVDSAGRESPWPDRP